MSFFSDISTIAKLLPQVLAALKNNTAEQKNTQGACAATVTSNGATQESNAGVIASDEALIESNTELGAGISKLQATLDKLNDEAPPAPGEPTIQTVSQITKEDGTMGLKFGLAPVPLDASDPNDNDVVKRVVTATNTTKGTPTQTATVTQPDIDTSGPCYAPGLLLLDDAGQPFIADAGDSIDLTDQVTDKAGNASAVETNTVTVVDNVAPPAPGQVAIQTVAQV